MRRITRILLLLAMVAMPILQYPQYIWADSDEGSANKKEIVALRLEIEKLKNILAGIDALNPNLTSLMPDFSERFHVMHAAGDAGDWAVAAHELLELERMMGLAQIIDPDKGLLMKSFLEPTFKQIKGAIDHGNHKAFLGHLEKAVTSCNACHVAVQAPYIKVSLNVDEIMSIRHSHKFTRSEVDSSKGGGHKH